MQTLKGPLAKAEKHEASFVHIPQYSIVAPLPMVYPPRSLPRLKGAGLRYDQRAVTKLGCLAEKIGGAQRFVTRELRPLA